MVEIYSKGERDYDYDEDAIDVTNSFSIYLNEIRHILGGSMGSTMGALDMPVDLEHYVYETSINEAGLANLIYDKLATHAQMFREFQTNVSVNFAKGEIRDVCLINIRVNGGAALSMKIT